MQHRRRRRWDVFFVVLAVLAVGVVAAVAAAAADTERITGYWAGARVGADGQAEVTEVIDYDFGPNPRHGIFRDIPDLPLAAEVTVSSPTAPDQFVLEPLAFDETRVRIGDPFRTITGRHRYRIDYRVGVGFAGGVISWNAVGDGWSVPMRGIEVHLVAPAALDEVVCSKGTRGSWGGCTATQPEPGHLVVRIDDLSANEGVTVTGRLAGVAGDAAALPSPPSGAARDAGAGIVKPGLVAALVALVAALVMRALVRRAGREYVWAGGSADAAFGPGRGEEYAVRRIDHDDLGELATTEFAPPEGLAPWQGGVLLAERVGADQQAAWLVERAIAGELELEGSGRDVTIRQNAATPPGELVAAMFGGRSEVALGKYDKTFASAWTRLGGDLGRWLRDSPLWDAEGDRQQRRIRVWAVLGIVVGVVLVAGGAAAANRWDAAWLFALAGAAVMAGSAFGALLTSWELRVRTPAGSGLWLRSESFRRFLADSEARHADEAADKGLLLQYTAWAVAVGEIDRWSKAVAASSAAAGAAGSASSMRALHFAAVAPSLSRAATSAATAPSSSSGGGGGSVGGGGGGGGGGSW